MPSSKPIGLFDSGVGGLSVMREVRRLLPAEDLLYYADSAHCPYGVKPPEEILSRAFAICNFLLTREVKMIVIASNTTSIVGLDAVRKSLGIPVVGIEPAVKPAVQATRNGRVGVLATGVTLAGERFNSLLERFGNGVEVYTQPCPGLVELVEAGRCNDAEAQFMLARYLNPLQERGTDTLVLGCTHYPFLRPVVEEIMGSEVRIIDTGEPVARQVARILGQSDLASLEDKMGTEQFFTSGDPEEVEPVIRLLWDNPTLVVEQLKV